MLNVGFCVKSRKKSRLKSKKLYWNFGLGTEMFKIRFSMKVISSFLLLFFYLFRIYNTIRDLIYRICLTILTSHFGNFEQMEWY